MIFFSGPIRARESGLTEQGRPSRPASACLLSTLVLNLVLTHGIPPTFRGGVHIFIPPTAIGPVPSLPGYAIAYRRRALQRVRRYRPSSPQGSSSNGYCFSGITVDQFFMRLSFPILDMTMCNIVQKVSEAVL